MGIFDSAREQAEKLMEEHGEKVEQPSDQVLDRVAAEANERTGGSYDAHVDRARDTADAHIGAGEHASPAAPQAQGAQQARAVPAGPVDPPAES